ncbi:hypothetical protein MUK42_24542 [Musa troglodytarum]|uniref:Uncharacterized protein n=1 Tax=Musa troglodytarum TaxID=320322 RepID=A0A9E7F5R4_9LILI|nr:hypothetical protein MUK42_24542 [Musa troglodytarum]
MAAGTATVEQKKKNLHRCRGNDDNERCRKGAEEEKSSSVSREQWQRASKSCGVEGTCRNKFGRDEC